MMNAALLSTTRTLRCPSCRNRERTGVPARAARVGWWMRPGQRFNLAVAFAISVARFAGLGFLEERDPRVTLAALAHPGLQSAAAPRLVDGNKPS